MALLETPRFTLTKYFKYSNCENSAIEKLQRVGITDEIFNKRMELAARRLKSACLTTHIAKVSMELVLGCFYQCQEKA